MSTNLDNRLIEVGYFLSRLGKKEPPKQLRASSWKEAYAMFYGALGGNKTEEEFKNSLKNLRDHFDSHLDNERTGWREDDGSPQKLSGTNQEVFDYFEKLSNEELWKRIRPIAITTFDSALAKKKNKELKKSGAKYFSSEFSGKKNVKSLPSSVADVVHGFIVDSLRDFAEKNFNNTSIFNTQKVDLAIEISGTITTLFEVKTSFDTQAIYTAVGQLFMHSADLNDVKKIVVLPDGFQNQETINCLTTLKIEIIWYSIDNGLCSFRFN